MKKKHPTLGKRTLARMYLLAMAERTESLVELDPNSPTLNTYDTTISKKEKFVKFLNSV